VSQSRRLPNFQLTISLLDRLCNRVQRLFLSFSNDELTILSIRDRKKHLKVNLSTAIVHRLGETSQDPMAPPNLSDSISAASDDAANKITSADEDEMALYLGLRVYTRDEAVVKITSVLGQ